MQESDTCMAGCLQVRERSKALAVSLNSRCAAHLRRCTGDALIIRSSTLTLSAGVLICSAHLLSEGRNLCPLCWRSNSMIL